MSLPERLSWRRVEDGLLARPEATLSYLIRRHRVHGGTDTGYDLIVARGGIPVTTAWASTQQAAKIKAEMNYRPAAFGLTGSERGLPS